MELKEVDMEKDLQITLMKKLEQLESSTDLEGTAIITKTGLRIASSSLGNPEITADLHSAGPAALISLGEKLSQGLQYGELRDIVITGDQGYTIITVGGPGTRFILLTHCRKESKLGYYFHRLRKAYRELMPLLENVGISSAQF
ncbi:MAG: roadblock/LC7 domain-containing protein [Candidatus Lokiarchaeota archaeon]|nr:roadblock/LC7 domain-containing protein [Candidatus Lokiarchaeota archaeon]